MKHARIEYPKHTSVVNREGVKFHIDPGVHEAIAWVVADRHISDISNPAMHWSLVSIYWVFLTADEHFCRHHVVLPLRMLLPDPGEQSKAWEGKDRPSGWEKSELVPDEGVLDVLLLESGERRAVYPQLERASARLGSVLG